MFSSKTKPKASPGVGWLWGQARAFSPPLPSQTPFTPTGLFLVTAPDGQVLTQPTGEPQRESFTSDSPEEGAV